jgi:hypothetical protein
LNNRIPLEKRYGALGWDSIILHISQVGWHQIDDSFVELGDWIQHKND